LIEGGALHDRRNFQTPEEAIRAWGKISGMDLTHVRNIIRLLGQRLGPVHSPYIGQQGNVVGMSFGASQLVDVYVSPEKLDIAPHAVVALGGLAVIRAIYPGFDAGPGQRSDHARFVFSGYQRRHRAEGQRRVDQAHHCGVEQPVGSECMYCGEVVRD
jgi:hypothetical protein